jgi:hypothetical protein
MDKLVDAVKENNLQEVKKILGEKNIDPSSHNGLSLMISISLGYDDITELLLKDERTDPNCKNDFPIRFCYNNSQFILIDRILEHPKFKISEDSHSLCETLINYHRYDLIEKIIEKSAYNFSVDNNRYLRNARIDYDDRMISILLKDINVYKLLKQKGDLLHKQSPHFRKNKIKRYLESEH